MKMSAPLLRLCAFPLSRLAIAASGARSAPSSTQSNRSASLGLALAVASDPTRATRRTPGVVRARVTNVSNSPIRKARIDSALMAQRLSINSVCSSLLPWLAGPFGDRPKGGAQTPIGRFEIKAGRIEIFAEQFERDLVHVVGGFSQGFNQSVVARDAAHVIERRGIFTGKTLRDAIRFADGRALLQLNQMFPR